MLSFILDFRFKSLKLVSFVIGQEHGVFIVEKYDKRSLFPMLLKCYHILYLMAKFGPMTKMKIDAKSSFDIFEMLARTNEPTKELVNKEFQMFRRF
jgi:hypothetical protein